MHALQLLQMDVFHPPLARFLGYTEQPVTLFHLLLDKKSFSEETPSSW